MGTSSTTLGLIAGAGSLPRDIARAARERGHRVVAVALRGCCDSGLRELADEFHWLEVGELNALFEVFREARVKDAVMAGKVSKQRLFQAAPGAGGGEVKLDERAARELGSLGDQSDDAILGAVADLLAAEGILLRPQGELVPELLPGAGPLGHLSPTPAQWLDIEFGFEIAKALGEQGIGQSVVVRQRAVLAVEAIEGTDAAIARGAALGGAGVCVVKVAKPRQDPRFDLPAIGPETVSVMQGAGAAVLAFEADATLVLQRPKLVRDADAAGIALVGVSSEGLRDRASGAGDR
jgi:DUF1009 family protein